MDLRLSDEALASLAARIYADAGVADREVLWSWGLSRVERIRLSDGQTFVLKRALEPMADEARIIRALSSSAIPLPSLYLADLDGGVLTMIIEDLGPAVREPTLAEAADVAVRIHGADVPVGLAEMGERQLTELPSRALESLRRLESMGRWSRCEDLSAALAAAKARARELGSGATIAPYGLCHSEFHPSSVHVGTARLGVLDFARVFRGPGLLDLASYHGTVGEPEPAKCRELIDAYIAAGGHPDAALPRAGVRPERWAIFWHRLWVAEWFLRSCETWMMDRSQDATYQDAVERHVYEALAMLEPV